MNTDLFEKAKELGEMLAATDEYKRMRRAGELFEADAEATENLAKIEQMREELQRMEGNLTPDSVEALRLALRELKQKVDDDRVIGEMQSAKEEFNKLMGEVNSVIRFVITGESAAAANSGHALYQDTRQVH